MATCSLIWQGVLHRDHKYGSQLPNMATRYLIWQRVLHRDLSAANVFLDYDACIVVGDLGFSKRFSASDAANHNELATTMCGTVPRLETVKPQAI